MPNQEHEKERDQTHSYWYIPSALRVDYPLLAMEGARMMKMATGEGFPLRQGAETGLYWFSVATEACGGRTLDLGYVLEVSVYIRGFGVENKSGGPTESPRGTGARPRGVGAPSTLMGPSWLHRPTSSSYIYQYTLKPSGNRLDREFRRRKPL